MTRKVFAVLMFLPLVAPTYLSAQTNAKKDKIGDKTYDLSASNFSGDTVRGPRRIVATHLNILRYDYKFNNVVSFSAAPDLWSKLTQLNSPAAAPAGNVPKSALIPAAVGAPTAPCNQDLQTKNVLPTLISALCAANAEAIFGVVNAQTKQIDTAAKQATSDNQTLGGFVRTANCNTSTVVTGGEALTDFLQTTNGDPSTTIAGIRTQLLDSGGTPCSTGPASKDSAFISGTKAGWVDFQLLAQLRSSAQTVKTALDSFNKTFPKFITDQSSAIGVATNALQAILDGLSKGTYIGPLAQLQAAKDEVNVELGKLGDLKNDLNVTSDDLSSATQLNSSILAAIPDLEEGGAKYTSLVQARDQLNSWKARMSNVLAQWTAWSGLSDAEKAVTPDPFSMSTLSTCEFAFSRTKTTAITLSRTDRTPGSTTTSPETVLSVNVECTSPFTVSAGVAFSTIGQKEYAIQPVASPPGSTTTTSEFVTTSTSSFHPLVIGMIHARLWELNDKVSFHASFGMAGNFNSQSAGGSAAEFLIGPSFSFFRTMFITPGLHIGRKVTLGDGFKVGDPVPTSITSPPLQNSYTPAFGVAITFTKP
jgi:hypothetical protein